MKMRRFLANPVSSKQFPESDSSVLSNNKWFYLFEQKPAVAIDDLLMKMCHTGDSIAIDLHETAQRRPNKTARKKCSVIEQSVCYCFL